MIQITTAASEDVCLMLCVQRHQWRIYFSAGFVKIAKIGEIICRGQIKNWRRPFRGNNTEYLREGVEKTENI